MEFGGVSPRDDDDDSRSDDDESSDVLEDLQSETSSSYTGGSSYTGRSHSQSQSQSRSSSYTGSSYTGGSRTATQSSHHTGSISGSISRSSSGRSSTQHMPPPPPPGGATTNTAPSGGGGFHHSSPSSLRSQSSRTRSSAGGGGAGGIADHVSPSSRTRSSRTRSSRTGTGSRSETTGRSSTRSMKAPPPSGGGMNGTPSTKSPTGGAAAIGGSYSGRNMPPQTPNSFASDSYSGSRSTEPKSERSRSRSSSHSSGSSPQITDSDDESSTMRGQDESYQSKSSRREDSGDNGSDQDDDSVSVSDEEESAYEVASRSKSLHIDPDPSERRRQRLLDNPNYPTNGDNNTCKSIAVLGTMSDAGKSIITAGLCRILANGGVRVVPFKAQNMSNNASPALLPDLQRRKTLYEFFSHGKGKSSQTKKTHLLRPPKDHDAYGEIGTAQALQAEACRQIPRVEMNPVLLKSGGKDKKTGEYLCSVVVMGQQVVRETYGELGQRTDDLRKMVVDCHDAIAEVTKAEAIVIEGAGSCTELNLMERDIVNLPLVRAINCPWLLVANIDPGGVFAQIVGTKMCVSEEDWEQCVGVIVNKLRGEAKYFEPGPKMIADMVGKPVFVVPFLKNLNLPEEDGLGIERRLKWESTGPSKADKGKEKLPLVVVVAYPHTAIADDICPLERDSRFHVQWRQRRIPRKTYPHVTAIILPGSRLTRLDLKWLNDSGWGEYIRKHVAAGGNVLGLCGGYQMLGWSVEDPLAVEGSAGSKQGLGLLPIDTTIAPAECKVVAPRKGKLFPSGIDVEGFELHCGQSRILEHVSGTRIKQHIHPLLTFEDGRPEGMCSGRVSGTYLHGILGSPRAREKLLIPVTDSIPSLKHKDEVDPLDRFAEHLESCGLDFDTVISMMLNQSPGTNGSY